MNVVRRISASRARTGGGPAAEQRWHRANRVTLSQEGGNCAWVRWGGKWPADSVPRWVRGLADPAEREAAVRLLESHDAATRQHFVSWFVEYALLGDAARSLQSVQHHARLPPATWMQDLWWPELAAVRRAPGFVQAQADLGMTAPWDARGAPDRCERSANGTWTCR